MNTTTQDPYSTVADLDSTAKYLPAPVDTWVIPDKGPSAPVARPGPAHQEEEIRALRESVAGLTLLRDQLQAELKALTSKRDELEEALLTRESLLSRHELELGARQDQITALQAEIKALSAKPQVHEQVAHHVPGRHTNYERELADRDRRLADLKEELAARTQQQFLLTAERDDLQARLDRARSDLNSMVPRRERKPDAAADSELARRSAALARSQDDVIELQRRLARNHDALQRAETRRQVFETMLRDREELSDARDTRLRDLQAELDRQRRDHGAELERANSQLAAAMARGPERHFGEPFPGIPSMHAEPSAGALPPGASAPPAGVVQRLLVRATDDADIVHVLGRRTTIGRTPANDLCIDSNHISRHHAVLVVTDNVTVIEDLNSTNGVLVNDVPVTRHELRDGDLITIGKTGFRYVLKPATAQS